MSVQNVPSLTGTDIFISWTWNYWTVFWIVVVPVSLLVWLMGWILRRHNHDPKAREAFSKGEKLR